MIATEVVELLEPALVAPGFRIFTTIEGANPGGSIKDHLVLGELEELRDSGRLRPGMKISEVSAGSTALSLATHARAFALDCHLFLPQNAPDELRARLRALGATVHLHPRESIYAAHDEFSRAHGTWPLRQLEDPTKSRHYVSLGRKIAQLTGGVDAVVGAVGTGHSLKGVAQGLGNCRTISAEPEPGLMISGIRNIDSERYGSHDSCRIEDFDERLIIPASQCYHSEKILASRAIRAGSSFHVVLGAVRRLISTQSPCRLLALGASNTYL